MAEDWTPYALEPLRGYAMWRRRIFALLAFLLLAGGWVVYSGMNTTRTISTGFGDGSSSEIDLKTTRKPLTLTVSPGRLSTAPGVVSDPTPTDTMAPPRQNTPGTGIAQTPIAIRYYLTYILPVLLVLGLALILGRRRIQGMDEVNYGIYKGAMPLEMISASYKHLVITNRRANAPLFGKGRQDYVPRHVALASDTAAEEGHA